MSIRDNILNYNNKITGNARLIAVSKTKPIEDLQEAYEAGQRLFGENKALEMRDKHEILPKDIRWHFIGHLQTNKVKYIIDKVDLIHSVDSYKLACEISKRAQNIGKIQDILVEVNIGNEESKGGVNPNDLLEFISTVAELEGIRIRGLMCIPPKIQENGSNFKYFSNLKQLSVDINDKKIDNVSMNILSMGMSDDFEDAIKAGSSFIRVGQGIFGARN